MLIFAAELLQIVRTTCISCSWGEFPSVMYVEGGRKLKKFDFMEFRCR